MAVRSRVSGVVGENALFAPTSGRPAAVIDCFNLLDDKQIRRYFELGCEVKGLGRGHVKRIKDSVACR